MKQELKEIQLAKYMSTLQDIQKLIIGSITTSAWTIQYHVGTKMNSVISNLPIFLGRKFKEKEKQIFSLWET